MPKIFNRRSGTIHRSPCAAFLFVGTAVTLIIASLTVLFGANRSVQAQNVLRIAAVVNDEIISIYDLAQRIRLVIATTDLPNSPDIRRRLAAQVLRTMIDERLQLQEAKRENIRVSQREIRGTLANIEKRNGMKPGELDRFLAENGIDKAALLTQIRARIAWLKLINRKLRRQVAIGDEEIDDELRRLAALQNKPHNRVSEIFLSVDNPEQDREVRQAAERLVQQIRAGARFAALAREFSQSTTAATGGDLGWVAEGELPKEIERALSAMEPGEISDPVRTLSGYHILYLRERRLPGQGAQAGTVVELRRIQMPLSSNGDETEARGKIALAREIRAAILDCQDMEAVARSLGDGTTSSAQTARIEEIPPPLRRIVAGLPAGKVSQPIRTPDTIQLIMVCSRKAGKIALPSREAVERRLLDARLDLLAQRYLRDLRRAAFVDIRQ